MGCRGAGLYGAESSANRICSHTNNQRSRRSLRICTHVPVNLTNAFGLKHQHLNVDAREEHGKGSMNESALCVEQGFRFRGLSKILPWSRILGRQVLVSLWEEEGGKKGREREKMHTSLEHLSRSSVKKSSMICNPWSGDTIIVTFISRTRHMKRRMSHECSPSKLSILGSHHCFLLRTTGGGGTVLGISLMF
jgi:hypothetical protein